MLKTNRKCSVNLTFPKGKYHVSPSDEDKFSLHLNALFSLCGPSAFSLSRFSSGALLIFVFARAGGGSGASFLSDKRAC